MAAVQTDDCILARLLRRLHQRGNDQRIGNSRKFRRHDLIACALAAHAAGGNYQPSGLHPRLHAAAGADADDRLRSRRLKLLHRRGHAGAAHAAAGHANGRAVRRVAGVGRIGAAVRRKFGVAEQIRNDFAAMRVARHQHARRTLAGRQACRGKAPVCPGRRRRRQILLHGFLFPSRPARGRSFCLYHSRAAAKLQEPHLFVFTIFRARNSKNLCKTENLFILRMTIFAKIWYNYSRKVVSACFR